MGIIDFVKGLINADANAPVTRTEQLFLGFVGGFIVGVCTTSLPILDIEKITSILFDVFTISIYLIKIFCSGGLGMLWVFLNDKERRFTRLTVFQLGIVGPSALISLVLSHGTPQSLINKTTLQNEASSEQQKTSMLTPFFDMFIGTAFAQQPDAGAPMPQQAPPQNGPAIPQPILFDPSPSLSNQFSAAYNVLNRSVTGGSASSTQIPPDFSSRVLQPPPAELDASKRYYFTVVGSYTNINYAMNDARKIYALYPGIKIALYPPLRGNSYGLMIAAWTTLENASQAQHIAQDLGIAADAYIISYPFVQAGH